MTTANTSKSLRIKTHLIETLRQLLPGYKGDDKGIVEFVIGLYAVQANGAPTPRKATFPETDSDFVVDEQEEEFDDRPPADDDDLD